MPRIHALSGIAFLCALLAGGCSSSRPLSRIDAATIRPHAEWPVPGGFASADLTGAAIAPVLSERSSDPDPESSPAILDPDSDPESPGIIQRKGRRSLRRPALHRRRGQVGVASFYHPSLNGLKTANGEIYDDRKLTAASRTLALGTRVRVTNLDNQKSVVVTVNDRGPYVGGRIIDLSRRAASTLGFVDEGLTRVRVVPL